MNVKVGDTLVIHCYKHNGVIYESSKVAYVIDIKDDYIVLGDENVLITKQDGRRWHTKGSAIMFFYKKRWFNIIAQIKSDGIFYYCNIILRDVFICVLMLYIFNICSLDLEILMYLFL